MKQVAVYSGTFDPIHLGHEWLIDYCLNDRRFDEVIILVEPDPRRKEDASSFKDRVAMVKLRYADEPRVSVNPFEDYDDRFTLSATLPRIREYCGEADIALVMGGDVFEYVPSWDGIQGVLDSISFIVALRTEDDGEIAVGLLSDELSAAQVHMVASSHPKISSTKVRQQLAEQESSDFIHDSICQYVIDNELFG